MANTKQRIVLIGPTGPLFKGGIVHYTHALATALAAHAEVTVISFSRAYPKWLYRGVQEPQVESEFKLNYRILPLIDWANPFSWMNAGKEIKKLQPSKVILQWWTAFWGIPLLFLPTPGVGKKGLIVHNISDHEKIPFSKQMGNALMKKSDFLITHATTMQKTLMQRYPTKKILLQLHPTHTMFTNNAPAHRDPKALLFFGHVRPYKGLPVLIDAFESVKKKIPDATLTIVGEFWNPNDVPHGAGITVINRYIADNEVPKYFAKSAALVMPYLHGTGTAVSKVALATTTPIIATQVGDLPDIFALGNVGILVPPNDPAALSDAIVAFLKKKQGVYNQSIQRVAKELTWNNYAMKLLNL